MRGKAYIAVLSALWLSGVVRAGPPANTAEPLRRVEIAGGYYLVSLPAGYQPGDRAPLILALHGTDSLAEDMVRVWCRAKLAVPPVVAAVQNGSPGWEDTDAELIEAAFEDLEQRFGFDRRRVLLSGHSAGGAMTMYMLYDRGFPATAAATSANYLPPTVTPEKVRAQANVPLFYAVGRADVNHERMRDALVMLRTSGASVTMPTLDIGHVLDTGVIRQAAAWFGQVCDRQASDLLEDAAQAYEDGRPADGIRLLEEIITQQAYWPADLVSRTDQLHAELMMPANGRFHAIQAMIAADRKVEAVRELAVLEADYAGCRLADTARALRTRLGQDPQVAPIIEAQREAARADEARWMLEDVRRSLELKDYDQAKARCRILAEQYGDCPEGREAARLIDEMRWKEG